MKFLFEKLRTGKYDRLVVERDERKEEVPCPKIGGIPHDMVQADANSGFPAPAELIAMYRVTCDARGVVPFDVSGADIAAIRAEMRRLKKLWDATPPDGTLALSFETEYAH